LAGIPGISAYCQIGISTDTLSVEVDMPAIADGILVGDIDDSNGAFQKFGRLECWGELVSDPRGIIWAEKAMATAENDEEEAGARPNTKSPIPTADLSWPTMLTAKCREKGQHMLYNDGIIDVPCLCKACKSSPPPSATKKMQLQWVLRPTPPSTDLSQIPVKDRISTAAGAHGIVALTKFHKEVWRADTYNCLLHPDAYLSDCLMKEILDKFSLLNLKSVDLASILVPYKHLKNQEHNLFRLLMTLQVDFDRLAAEQKAKTAAKRKATAAMKAAGKEVVRAQQLVVAGEDESTTEGEDKNDTDSEDPGSNIASPSHQQVL
jgi:hypothetical protein